MKQNTLFDTEEARQKRNTKFVRAKSKNGELTIHINAETTKQIKIYCRLHNLNCKQYVNDVLAEHMAELEQVKYDDLSKDELIALLKKMEKEQ